MLPSVLPLVIGSLLMLALCTMLLLLYNAGVGVPFDITFSVAFSIAYFVMFFLAVSVVFSTPVSVYFQCYFQRLVFSVVVFVAVGIMFSTASVTFNVTVSVSFSVMFFVDVSGMFGTVGCYMVLLCYFQRVFRFFRVTFSFVSQSDPKKR